MLSILVIDESRTRAAEICAGLALAGHQVAAVLSSALDLARQVEAIQPDVILIETDSPSRDTLEHLATLYRDLPRPVIIFAQEGDAASIRGAMKAGVAAYVVDGLEMARLKPVIEVAVARFEENQALRRELAAASKKLSERKLVERAKGLLMKARGLDEEAAYASLRKLAMDRGKPIGVMAREVVDIAGILL
ncbi:MAG: ANTAR domain-containing protein [Rhodocyclales bacterium]|nr:ANTAR domain-containing protein [Rhodocyclales bacterium]